MTINEIARIITDDPDLLLEMGGLATSSMSPTTIDASDNSTLNATELSKQADQMSQTPEGSNAVADQLKAKQDMEKQQQQQKDRILRPQFDQLDDVMGQLQTGVLQGQQATQTGNQQFNGLDKEMVNLNTLLGNLRTQV